MVVVRCVMMAVCCLMFGVCWAVCNVFCVVWRMPCDVVLVLHAGRCTRYGALRVQCAMCCVGLCVCVVLCVVRCELCVLHECCVRSVCGVVF